MSYVNEPQGWIKENLKKTFVVPISPSNNSEIDTFIVLWLLITSQTVIVI